MTQPKVRQNDMVLLARTRAQLRSGEARRLREAAGFTQYEVARAVGVSAVAVSRWESGQRVPRGAAAMRLAKLLAEVSRLAQPTDAAS